MNDSNTLLIAGTVVLACVIPLALLGFTVLMLLRMARGALDTNVDGLHRRYQRLQTQRPWASRDALLGQIVAEQALRAGLIGAITGVGGVLTLPLGIAVDLALTLRIQINLVTFIEQVYTGGVNAGAAQLRSVVIMTGSGRAARWTTAAAVNAVTRVLGKSFAKVLPIIGAIISFAVNYAIMRTVGLAAVRWYADHANLGAGDTQPIAAGPR
jgi:hypothetical protein